MFIFDHGAALLSVNVVHENAVTFNKREQTLLVTSRGSNWDFNCVTTHQSLFIGKEYTRSLKI